jgi:putative phage-type endonuclease
MAFDRAQGIGGSDVAAILGLSPWRSAWDVWAEKTGDPSFTPQEESAAMRFGNLMEKVLADVYEQDHPGRKIRQMGGAHGDPIWHSNGINYAHIDGTISGDEEGVWEGKTARNDRDWRVSIDEIAVPEYYKAQAHSYLAVTGEPWCDVTVFFRDTATFAHCRIESDPAMEAGIIAASEGFWHDHVVPRIPPEIDGSLVQVSGQHDRRPADVPQRLCARRRYLAAGAG